MKFYLKPAVRLAIVVMTLCSCGRNGHSTEAPSGSDSSRCEKKFESVLLHYQGPADSLKRKAALFLIDNVPDKFSYRGVQYDLFVHFIDSLSKSKITTDEYKQVILDYYNRYGYMAGNRTQVKDLDSLTPELLISNIDQAFNAWQNAPWRKQVSFADFCEFILPYRVGDEPLEDFRKTFYDQFRYLYNDTGLDLEAAADSVLKVTSKKKFGIITYPEQVPDFPASRLVTMRAGSCRDVSCLSAYIMRSIGIPVANDFTPQWPHRGLGHDWSALILPDSCIDFEGAKSPKLGGHLRLSTSHRMAKAFRHTFGKQSGSLAMIHGAEPVPISFSTPI